MDLTRPLAALALGCAALAAVWSLWRSARPGPAAPSADEWFAARGALEPHMGTGDLIVVHPAWLREAAGLEALGEVAVTSPADPWDLARHPRVHVVVAVGYPDPDLPDFLEATDRAELVPGIRWVAYRVDSPVAADLTDRLDQAVVERWAGDAPPRRCTWSLTRARHECRGKPWEDVSVQVHQVAGSPRRCIMLHPYPDGGTVGVTFPAVPLAARLQVRAGFVIESARREDGSDAGVVVRIDGDAVAQSTVGRNDWAFEAVDVDTTALTGSPHAVTVEGTAQREAFRDLCVDAVGLRR